MSGRPSCITLKCEKHVITVLRYKFGSVYNEVDMYHNGFKCTYQQFKIFSLTFNGNLDTKLPTMDGEVGPKFSNQFNSP